MTKTRDQVQPDWEAICISMEHIGDLSNDSIDPNTRPPFCDWIPQVIKWTRYSKERDAIGVILEYELECRDLETDETRFKHMREGIEKAREILRYIKTGIPPADKAPAVPGKIWGDFEYRNEVVYRFDDPVTLSKQSKKIMKILIERPSHKISAVEIQHIDDKPFGDYSDKTEYDSLTVNNRLSLLRRQLRKKFIFPGDRVIPLIPGTMPSEYMLTDEPVKLR